jgi:hypothetical protein
MQDASVSDSPGPPAADIAGARRGWLARIGAALSAAVGAVAGAAPHVLHHIGPIAGAALLTGVGGTLLFGAIGFLLMAPMLLRLRRRFRSWAAPVAALALFAVMFTVSTLWIGPAIKGGNGGGSGAQPIDHASHHHG